MVFVPQTQPTTTNLLDLLIALIPWLILFPFLWYVVFRFARRQTRMNVEHIERMRQHMLAVEAKLDRLIAQGERRGGGQ